MTSAFINKHKEYIIDQYVNEKKSTYEIALDLKTYPNKIRRTLTPLGVPLRDKSAAQTVAINSGRHEHPTRGKKRTESEKVAISNGMSNYWDEMDDKERQRRSELSKKQWAEMPEYEKANLRKLAAEAVRKASKEGSKIEKFIFEGLTKAGYEAIFHKKGLVPNDKLEVESLQKHIRADAEKAGLLIARGYAILRVKNVIRNLSAKNMRDALEGVITAVKKVEKKFPPQSKRLIEIET